MVAARRDGDGAADERKSLSRGYGVHDAFIGHDLHGLRIGPDGKLYFSIGDRGVHVETAGRTLAVPDTGAVLRCNLDGSELEVFATGLRNPQELAFDSTATCSPATTTPTAATRRGWVHVVEGGDSGWRIGYQYLEAPPDARPVERRKTVASAVARAGRLHRSRRSATSPTARRASPTTRGRACPGS